MSFQSVPLLDMVRYAAYHEAAHIFFSLFCGMGLYGGAEISKDGLGISYVKNLDPFAAKYHRHNMHGEVVGLLAPFVLETILAKKPFAVMTPNKFVSPLGRALDLIKSCNENFRLIKVDPETGDHFMALMYLAILDMEVSSGVKDLRRLIKSSYMETISEIKGYYKNDSIVAAITLLAELLCKKESISRTEVFHILIPVFVKECWSFTQSGSGWQDDARDAGYKFDGSLKLYFSNGENI